MKAGSKVTILGPVLEDETDSSDERWRQDEQRHGSTIATRMAARRRIEEWLEDQSIEADAISLGDFERHERLSHRRRAGQRQQQY